MGTFLLIVWLCNTASLTITTVEFDNEASCREAFKVMSAVNQSSGISLRGVCVPKHKD